MLTVRDEIGPVCSYVCLKKKKKKRKPVKQIGTEFCRRLLIILCHRFCSMDKVH